MPGCKIHHSDIQHHRAWTIIRDEGYRQITIHLQIKIMEQKKCTRMKFNQWSESEDTERRQVQCRGCGITASAAAGRFLSIARMGGRIRAQEELRMAA